LMLLFTAGYQGRTLQECIRLLQKRQVTLLVDVRQNPISRKRGFSRTQLSRALENAGIRYIHIEQLGNPSEIRAEYRKNGNAIQLYEDFKHYLEDHPEGIHILLQEIQNERACLFCFERYPCYCHRGAIAEYLQERYEVKVEHL